MQLLGFCVDHYRGLQHLEETDSGTDHNVVGYTQVHLGPLDSFPMKCLAYDGMVDIYFDPQTCSLFKPDNDRHSDSQKDGARRYFEDVILVDEKRFWDRTDKGNVTGGIGWDQGGTGVVGVEKKVIVDGEMVIQIPMEVKQVWNGYNTGIELS